MDISFRLWLEGNELDEFWHLVTEVELGLDPEVQQLVTQFVGGHPPLAKGQIKPSRGQRDGEMMIMNQRPLEKSVSDEDDVYARLKAAFLPIKNAVRTHFGNRVILFRSYDNKSPALGKGDRRVLSFTLNPGFAKFWTYGYNDSQLAKGVWRIEVYDKMWWGVDADQMEEYIGLRRSYFTDKQEARQVMAKLKKAHPKETFQLKWDDQSKKHQRQEADKKHSAYVVPIDDVVWVTNRANQHEFICLNKEYPKMPFEKAQKLAHF